MNKQYLRAGRCPASDECLTPRYGVQPIIQYVFQREFTKIWCPFDKEDSMYVRVFRSIGLEVVATHIENGGDFFEQEPPGHDCIISNGPFSCKDSILKRLYALASPFAILLPQNSLQGLGRVRMFKEHGIEYMGFDRRINFYTRGELEAWKPANHFASGYFCKGMLDKSLIFKNLTPVQEHYHDF